MLFYQFAHRVSSKDYGCPIRNSPLLMLLYYLRSELNTRVAKVVTLTKKKIAQKLQPGLYEIFWKEGGSSLAAVGQNEGGSRWFAPVNWISVPGYDWKMVSYVKEILKHQIDLKTLPSKSKQRLKKLRNKYRRLKWTSHDGGAGGVKDSSSFKYYSQVVRKIDELLHPPV